MRERADADEKLTALDRLGKDIDDNAELLEMSIEEGAMQGDAFEAELSAQLPAIEVLARVCHCNRGPEDSVLSGVLFENIGDRDRLRIREFVVDSVE